MPSSHRRFLVFLSALGTLSAFDAVADTPTWTSTRIGLYGPEYTATAWNSQYTAVEYLNEAGHAAGYSARYFDTYQSQGQDAWVYNGTTTVQVGLTGTEYQSPINGYRYSAVLSLNAAGQAAGITRLQPVGMGQATWVYNGTSTVRVGLYGADFTRSDGYQYSQLNFFNALGQAAGTSSAYLQSPNGASGAPGEYAWFYDGVETVQ